MQHFYDGQIRRYITQIIRALSNFSYKDGNNELVEIPVVYGDLSRQVGAILKDNSELKVIGAPKISAYITGLELDKNRLSDSSYVSKVHIRERAYDSDNNEYLNKEGKNYTVERLMPTPYNLTLNADIWSTNTDQKLQILEQILVLFNPSLEIQTTDNFVDWTSLSVLNLESINWSSRSIGTSTETEIDVCTLGFSTPIYISPPVKVKKLGIIHTIITSIFNENYGNVDRNETMPELLAYSDAARYKTNAKHKVAIDEFGNEQILYDSMTTIKDDTDSALATTVNDFDILVIGNTVKLYSANEYKKIIPWRKYLLKYPETFQDNISEIRLYRYEIDNDIVGYLKLSKTDETILNVNWDIDTIPSDTIIEGNVGNFNKINYIIDPSQTDPAKIKEIGLRLLLLNEGIGNLNNNSGASAWKNNNGTDFVADINDIIEWDGSSWSVVFDASENLDTITYTTNLNTGIQYKFFEGDWILSYEGLYPKGSWRIKF